MGPSSADLPLRRQQAAQKRKVCQSSNGSKLKVTKQTEDETYNRDRKGDAIVDGLEAVTCNEECYCLTLTISKHFRLQHSFRRDNNLPA